MARFNVDHAFGYNSAESESIWMKSGALRLYIVWGWNWQILGAIRAEARAAEPSEVFFCQANNARLY